MEKFGKVIKIITISAILVFCAAVVLRIIFASYYPKDMKKIYYTDSLSDYYNENNGMKAETQKIRVYYDNNKSGSFFASHPIYIRDAGNLQITLRYNDSSLERVEKFYGTENLTPENSLFTYRLTVCYGDNEDGGMMLQTYESAVQMYDNKLFYNYNKVVFDGIDYTDATWMRVDIYLSGYSEVFGSIVVYENNSEWNVFSEYKIGKGERP